jgi:hypothetical protein
MGEIAMACQTDSLPDSLPLTMVLNGLLIPHDLESTIQVGLLPPSVYAACAAVDVGADDVARSILYRSGMLAPAWLQSFLSASVKYFTAAQSQQLLLAAGNFGFLNDAFRYRIRSICIREAMSHCTHSQFLLATCREAAELCDRASRHEVVTVEAWGSVASSAASIVASAVLASQVWIAETVLKASCTSHHVSCTSHHNSDVCLWRWAATQSTMTETEVASVAVHAAVVHAAVHAAGMEHSSLSEPAHIRIEAESAAWTRIIDATLSEIKDKHGI